MEKETIINKLKTIDLANPFCFFCGELFDKDKHLKTKHHAIPQALKPKFNVTVPVCKPCHETINNLYVNQQKRKKAPRALKYYANKFEGLVGAGKRLQVKIDKVQTELKQEIKDYEKIEKDGPKTEQAPSTN